MKEADPKSDARLFIQGVMILWPSLFVPSKIDFDDRSPKYRCSFTLPEGFEPPKWVYFKIADGRYDIPVGTRYVSVQSLNQIPVFGVDESVIKAAASTMQKVDKTLHGAQADVILSFREGRNGAVFLNAEAIRVVAPIALPTFETYLGNSQ